MRKILISFTLVLMAVGAFAAPRHPLGRHGLPAPAAPWITVASPALAGIASSATLPAIPNRPIVLLETNYYTYLPGDSIELRITTHPNGYSGAVTLYLYRENRSTGERLFYNLPQRGLMPTGVSDLFGAPGSPVPILVPDLADFVLFGSASSGSQIGWGLQGALGEAIPVAAGSTGLYQWVVEIRDPAGKRVISRSNAMFSHVEQTVAVSGTITSSTTWTADRRYVLNDFVGVAEPAVLTIQPGTVIYGGDPRASLFIRRGAKIVAEGTERRPVVFTSAQKVGERAQRDWGSLIVLGRAPINEAGGQGFMEGLPSQAEYAFGGTDSNDSSGVLRFVRLEFGGFEIEANQEINGLTLAGVGRGTVVDYVQVLHNKDDAFEFFGGTVNASHLISVAAADDSIDWDLGYQGNIQFVAVVKRAANDENDGNIIIEGDGHPQNAGNTPLSNPRLYNVTGYGTGRMDVGAYGNVLRRGTAGKIHNLIVMNSRRAPVTIRNDSTFAHAASGELVFDNSILFGDFSDAAFGSSDSAQQTRTFLFDTMKWNRNVDPLLAAGAPSQIRTLMPDLTPLPGSPALDADYVAIPPDDGFFKRVDFIGAVGPGDDWILSGWAVFSDN
ncbi:MAG TPA: hypothetical protein VM557_12275 [Thermoanaerobaculia bacterium]|nr:hypothetical protein [Thermoanaerobaculia bacterium]